MILPHQQLDFIAAACTAKTYASSVPGTRPCGHHFQPPPERERENHFYSLPCCLSRSRDGVRHRCISVDAWATQGPCSSCKGGWESRQPSLSVAIEICHLPSLPPPHPTFGLSK